MGSRLLSEGDSRQAVQGIASLVRNAVTQNTPDTYGSGVFRLAGRTEVRPCNLFDKLEFATVLLMAGDEECKSASQK